MNTAAPGLAWRTADPHRLIDLLGAVAASEPVARVVWVRLRVVKDRLERLEALEAAATGRERRSIEVPVLAAGWATIDVERWGPTEPIAEDRLLGARAAVPIAAVPGSMADVPAVAIPAVLLEPVTEGRLAGFLARHGEGLAALYVPSDGRSEAILHTAAGGASPFGAARLAFGGRDGPFLVVCDAPFAPLPGPRTINR